MFITAFCLCYVALSSWPAAQFPSESEGPARLVGRCQRLGQQWPRFPDVRGGDALPAPAPWKTSSGGAYRQVTPQRGRSWFAWGCWPLVAITGTAVSFRLLSDLERYALRERLKTMNTYVMACCVLSVISLMLVIKVYNTLSAPKRFSGRSHQWAETAGNRREPASVRCGSSTWVTLLLPYSTVPVWLRLCTVYAFTGNKSNHSDSTLILLALGLLHVTVDYFIIQSFIIWYLN